MAAIRPSTLMLALIDAGEARARCRAKGLFEKHGSDASLSVNVAGTDILAPVPEPRPDARRHVVSAAYPAVAARPAEAGCARRRTTWPNWHGSKPSRSANCLKSIAASRSTTSPTASACAGTNTTVKWPRYSKVMDYEPEFGIVTKNKGANISAAKAKDHIFGYTIFNDFSARDAQRLEMEGRLGPAKGKSFDGGNVLGPWIVTPDEIGDPYKLKMECRVNGKVRSSSTSEGMLFSFEEIIAHVTQDETLMPGEFIGSGTVGNGCGLELGWYLEHNDEIELEVEKIGDVEEQGGAAGYVTHLLSTVIARSEATRQSRSNKRRLDCFVARLLAMTTDRIKQKTKIEEIPCPVASSTSPFPCRTTCPPIRRAIIPPSITSITSRACRGCCSSSTG